MSTVTAGRGYSYVYVSGIAPSFAVKVSLIFSVWMPALLHTMFRILKNGKLGEMICQNRRGIINIDQPVKSALMPQPQRVR